LRLDETEAIPIVCAASLRSGGPHELTTEMLACRDVGVTLLRAENRRSSGGSTG
jgi:hypothetical protein